MLTNTHKVPAKTWHHWTDDQRLCFNETFATGLANQSTINCHPNTVLLGTEPWRTVCWNLAWQAALCLTVR